MKSHLVSYLSLTLLALSCFPSISGAQFKCAMDSDCSALGMVCGPEKVCTAGTEADVTTGDLQSDGADAMTPAPRPKLDILWVLDESSSMCQEQQSLAASFSSFLKVFQAHTAIDMRIAVTTTTVCDKSKPNPGRGKFVYQPASDLMILPECAEKQVRACLSDDQCKADTSLPDRQNWVCEKPQTAQYLYSCDKPASMCPGSPNCDDIDKHPGDLLLIVQSMCRYQCDKENAPAACGKVFGPRLDGSKAYGDQPCDHMCSGGSCSIDTCNAEPFLVGFSEATASKPECTDACASDWDCAKKCESYLFDSGKCAALCETPAADCYSACVFAGTDTKNYADKVFPRQDFLCSVVCDKSYDCKDSCIAEFAHAAYRCLYPGGDSTKAGCMLSPPTSYCPVNGPKVLDKGDFSCCLDAQNAVCTDHLADASVTCTYFKTWKSGDWAGHPDWKTLPDAEVYERVFQLLFTCMATVGTGQQPCGNQEQGLLAGWLALDPNGENSEQAQAFLRPEAYLLIIVVSDEDDCSTQSTIPAAMYPYCACLADKNGCRADGTCNIESITPFSINQQFDARVLYSEKDFVNQFKSLKSDPTMVVFAAITGDAIPGSTTAPPSFEGQAPTLEEIRGRYYDCKCPNASTAYSPQTYVCYSNQGKADLGKRYIDVAAAFGASRGKYMNICDDSGLAPALEGIAHTVVQLLFKTR